MNQYGKNIKQQCISKTVEKSLQIYLTDGSAFKNNALFSVDPSALQIIFYQDAFEVCNLLGSSKKKHKIVGVYMSLGILLPHHCSAVDIM